MKLILLGPVGSGKGTQAGLISTRFGLPHISTGEIFRTNIKNNTELGKIADKVEEKAYLYAKMSEEELRKEKLKQKYEELAKRKREKEEKQIALINERQEKEKKLRKEKEDARKERKEKALLIKKAQEESKLKEKKERKTFKEKASDWYNNLSIVKDAKNRRELQRQTLLIDFEGADAVRSEEKIMYKYVAKNKETGKVKHVGFSYHDNYVSFCEIIDTYSWDMCLVQYNLIDEDVQVTSEGIKYADEVIRRKEGKTSAK